MDTIKRVPRDHYKQLDTSTLDNPEEVNEFLELYHLPRLSYEEIIVYNKSIANKDVEFLIKTLSTKRGPGWTRKGSLENSVKIPHRLTSAHLKLFHSTEEKGALPDLVYNSRKIHIAKLDKYFTRNEK